MAAPAPTGVKNYYGAVSVASTATLIFDGSQAGYDAYWWKVKVANLDIDAGDNVFVGSDASVDLTSGYPLSIYADASQAHEKEFLVPPHGNLYAICTAAETRDVRVFAQPVI